MKIALASEGNFVSAHFGHCEGFEIYEVEGSSVLKKEYVENPGHRPGFLPVYLKGLSVDVIIAGGMGGSAQELFSQNNIKVIVGAEGKKDDVIKKYMDGILHSSDSVCHKHEHHEDCGE